MQLIILKSCDTDIQFDSNEFQQMPSRLIHEMKKGRLILYIELSISRIDIASSRSRRNARGQQRIPRGGRGTLVIMPQTNAGTFIRGSVFNA